MSRSTLLAAMSASLGIWAGCDGDPSAVVNNEDEFAIDGPKGTIETRTLRTEAGAQEVQVEVVDGFTMLEGDIILDGPEAHESGRVGRAAAINGHRWAGGVIPYKISPDLPNPERIDDAISRWESVTSVRFVPYTNQSHHVLFMSDKNCKSWYGQQDWAEQGIRLSTRESINTIAGIAIAHSDDHVYYWYKNGFVTSGTSSEANSYRPHYKYTLPPGKTPDDIVDMGIAHDDHVYAWYKDGTVSSGTSSDLDAYRARYTYTTAPGKTPNDIAGIGIAKDDDVYTWYKDGTVSRGNSSDLDKYQAPYSYSLPPGKTISSIAKIDIAGSDDHIYSWFIDVDPNSRTGKVSSGTSSDFDKYRALYEYKLPKGCGPGTTAHEMGHALGLYHEQSRQDRDNFVTIHTENIDSDRASDFWKYDSGTDIGAYDYLSIMHYGSFTGSKNGLATITKKDGSMIDQQDFPSAGDIAAIAQMY